MDVIRINLGFSYVAPIIRGQKRPKTGLEAQNGSYVAPIISEIGTPKKSLFRLRPPFFPFSYVAPILSGSEPSKTLKNPTKWRVNTGFLTIFEKSTQNPYVAPIPNFQKSAFFRLFQPFSTFLGFLALF